MFLNANSETTPLALRANLEHNGTVHENVMIVCVQTERVPHVPDARAADARRPRLHATTASPT